MRASWLSARLISMLLISQGPTLNNDLSASSSSSSVEISGLMTEAKKSGHSHNLVLSSDEVHSTNPFFFSKESSLFNNATDFDEENINLQHNLTESTFKII